MLVSGLLFLLPGSVLAALREGPPTPDQPDLPVPTSADPPEVAEPDPAAMLTQAIQTYQSGEPARARRAIQDILALGPSLPAATRLESLAWLGEILLAEQGMMAARSAFEALLGEEPDFVMDPFHHSPDTCSAFEDLRREWKLRRPTLPLPGNPIRDRGPWPGLLLVPGGVYYFERGKPVAGVLIGGLQLAGAATSALTAAQLIQRRGTMEGDDETALQAYRNLSTVNVASSIITYTAYLTPLIAESVLWASRPTLTVGPTGVTLSGSF